MDTVLHSDRDNEHGHTADAPIPVVAPLKFPAVAVRIWPSLPPATAGTARPVRGRISNLIYNTKRFFKSQRQPNAVPAQTIIMGCPHFFQEMETKYGIDKPDADPQVQEKNAKGNAHHPRPLTQCVGEEWLRQRCQVQVAFHQLPNRSLQVAQELVDIPQILGDCAKNNKNINNTRGPSPMPSDMPDACRVVDLKEVSIQISIQWVVGLFRGCRDQRLATTCRKYWQVSRSYEPVSKAVLQAKRKEFVNSFVWDHVDSVGTTSHGIQGLFTTLHPRHSGLSFSEAQDNAVNAMIAAHDAVQALLFWTLWNLSRNPDQWRRARDVALKWKFAQDSNNTMTSAYVTDLTGLANFKQSATKGELVNYSNLSILARALCETVRVFPPVWTLPRTWPGKVGLGDQEASQEAIYWSKVDVPTVNGASDYTDWDPDGPISTIPSSTHIASFGLGKRHCPAGTAALHAVYHFLTILLVNVEELRAAPCEGSAIDSVHLLPTLSLVDPQLFYVTLTNR